MFSKFSQKNILGKRGRPKKSEQQPAFLDTAIYHEPRKLRTRPVKVQATAFGHIALNFPIVAKSPQKQKSSAKPLPTQTPAITLTAGTPRQMDLPFVATIKADSNVQKKEVAFNNQLIVSRLPPE